MLGVWGRSAWIGGGAEVRRAVDERRPMDAGGRIREAVIAWPLLINGAELMARGGKEGGKRKRQKERWKEEGVRISVERQVLNRGLLDRVTGSVFVILETKVVEQRT